MLECRACVSHAIRVIAGDAQYATARPLMLTPHLSNIGHHRRRRLATAVHPLSHDNVPGKGKGKAKDEDALSVLEPIEKPTVEHYSPHQRGGQIVIANAKALRKELDCLKDPIKLADHVHHVLRCEQPDRALDLCRLASKNMPCTVSWNHVVSWHMGKKLISKAMDIYNEMKKRGQFPDSYTYMCLLKGFAQNKEHTMKAVSIYNSMSSPTSRVKPSIMHTNAALRVCSLTHDMDALWGIVSKLPEKGPNAPDAKTYTTILQAIRHSAMGDEADPSLMASQRQEAVNEGRRIWQEIITKWRAGELVIDETLVVAMADLLLISRRMEDWDDVLNLILQTTKLERLIAPLGSPERQTEHVRRDEEMDPLSQMPVEEDYEGFMPTPSANAFKPVTPPSRDPDRPNKRSYSLAWIHPGNAILSVLVRACTMMRTPKTANLYWDTLTAPPYKVLPDLSNFHTLLRLLRINRSSQRTAHVIQRMHNEVGIQAIPVTYAMAMSVCARDHKNRNIIDIATDVVDDMDKHLDYPDIQTLEGYLSVALTTNNGPNIVKAINRLMLFKKDLRDAPSLFQAMIGSVETLLWKRLVPDDAVEYWQEKRKELDGLLSTSKFNLQDKRRLKETGWNGSDVKRLFKGNMGRAYPGREEKLKAEMTRLSSTAEGAGGALRRFQKAGGRDSTGRPRRDHKLVTNEKDDGVWTEIPRREGIRAEEAKRWICRSTW